MSKHYTRGQSDISRRMNAGESIPAWRPPHLRDDPELEAVADQADAETSALRAAEIRLRASLQPWQIDVLDQLLSERT